MNEGLSRVDWSRFEALLREKRRILVTTHIRPDCDALGSQLGMYAILQRMGKDVRMVNAFEVPRRYHFLDPERRWERLDEVDAAWIDSIDLLLIVDTSAWAQLGDMAHVVRATRATVAVLDHHVSSDDLGAELFKDPSAEAAGRLVAEAAEVLGIQLTPVMATALFAALATDTGWFRFASVDARTYRLAAKLTEAGAVPADVYRELYEQETLPRLNLVGRTLGRAISDMGGRLVHTAITLDDFDATGALPSDSEDVINLTLTVAGTLVAVIFVEQRTGGFKLSFRSRCEVDCSRLAEQFGGGGHRAAAGAFVNESLDVLRERVIRATRQAMIDSGCA